MKYVLTHIFLKTVPMIMIVLENQEVIHYDISGEELIVSEISSQNWPAEIDYAVGGFLSDFLMIVGGVSTVSK